MVRIAPIRLSFNPKTLWFDARELDLNVGDAVVVSTVRGLDFGHVASSIFDMDYEETKRLKTPLKPVERLATEEDVERAEEMNDLSMQALPIFRQMAAIYAPDMNPIAVEYLFSGEKAVFYFDSEERIDFRDLVRKLAADLQIRVDMKQIGVRDGARMVGGLGHCGQELCCARLGGDFNPVSIRMAKEQDLSLNPQKISGVCGRLMCCLRYEFDAYKDFHSRAPKKNARIQTPDGEGKVVDLDVPREIISIKVGDEKPVRVPLADMDEPEEGARPNSVGVDAWEKAQAPAVVSIIDSSSLFTTQLSGNDKLAEPGKVSRMPSNEEHKPSRSRRRRKGSGRSSENAEHSQANDQQRKQRRRRSTTLSTADNPGEKTSNPDAKQSDQTQGGDQKKPSRRRSRNRSNAKASTSKQREQESAKQPKHSVQVGRNSSALRAGRNEGEEAKPGNDRKASGSGRSRRRRRSHKTNSDTKTSE